MPYNFNSILIIKLVVRRGNHRKKREKEMSTVMHIQALLINSGEKKVN